MKFNIKLSVREEEVVNGGIGMSIALTNASNPSEGFEGCFEYLIVANSINFSTGLMDDLEKNLICMDDLISAVSKRDPFVIGGCPLNTESCVA